MTLAKDADWSHLVLIDRELYFSMCPALISGRGDESRTLHKLSARDRPANHVKL